MGATSIGDVEPQADVTDASEAPGDASNPAEVCEEAGFRFFFVMLYRERSAYKLRCAVGVLWFCESWSKMADGGNVNWRC